MRQIFRSKVAVRTAKGGAAGLAVRAAVIGGCAMVLCACNTDQQITGVPEAPTDYRQRHPITLTEKNHTMEILIGSGRGELTASQRADVAAFAYSWRREAAGGVAIEPPVGAANEHAAAETIPAIRSILAASGVPANGIIVRPYPATQSIASVRVSYPRIAGQAGPCGMWPEDIGPSATRDHFENTPVWNAGCATQRNLAAMVDNPADLVQPRGETPAYTPRRTTALDKYRAGIAPATQYNTDQAKISDLGK